MSRAESRHWFQQRRPNGRQAGFTIVEFIVACSVVTIAFLGVYATFRDMMRLEQRYGIGARQNANARAVAEFVASRVEQIVNTPGVHSLVLSRDEDSGEATLVCTSSGRGLFERNITSDGVSRHRFRWGFSSPPQRVGTVEWQVMHWAGTKNITAGSDADMQLTEEQQWELLPVEVIGRDIQSMQISVRNLAETSESWLEGWDSHVGQVMVRIRVQAGDDPTAAVDRVILPWVSGELIGDSE